MGLLNSNSLNEWLTGIPERAREAYRGLLNTPSEVKQLFDPQFQQGLLKNATPVSREDIINQGLNISGMAPYGMAGHIVYHGSPHKFNKFDMSKIGTGEGAQAYGHGIYTAEAPDVAKTYANTLGEEVLVKGKPVYKAHNNTIAGDAPIGNAARNALQGSNWDLAKAKSTMQDAYKTSGDGYFKRAFDELSALSESDITRKTGAMYKVDIPDEAIPRMLDWDKPLSQQSPEVQAILRKADLIDESVWPHYTGESLYQGEMNARGPYKPNGFADNAAAPPISELLRTQGIPGIRYLDQGSRTAGEGTYNYVLFDDQLPRILEINGQPTGLLSWADEAKKVKKKK